MNEQLMLEHIRRTDDVSRADLARLSGLSKPTVSLALANLEREGLVRTAGLRTGVPGPAAILYEVRPEAGYVLGLDVGAQFLRGAVTDITGAVRSRGSLKTRAASGHSLVAELVQLAARLTADAGVGQDDIIQTVLGCPGVFDPERDAFVMTGTLPGWTRPQVVSELRLAFGPSLMLENDIDAAALAERTHGHGIGVDSFAYISVGTGIGMGLILGGKLHRGAHGAAGEIGYLPLDRGHGTDAKDARKRGSLEAAASAAGVVRAARQAGYGHPISARKVFAAARAGDGTAAKIVAENALMIAQAACSVISVVDPELIVLGGGIGQAEGFLEAVSRELRQLMPIHPDLRVSALGVDAVVDGCVAAGLESAWDRLTATLFANVPRPEVSVPTQPHLRRDTATAAR
jgi:predicted NBD/HSP70 family sugar kinase